MLAAIAFYLVISGASYKLGWIAAGAVIRLSERIRRPAANNGERIR